MIYGRTDRKSITKANPNDVHESPLIVILLTTLVFPATSLKGMKQ